MLPKRKWSEFDPCFVGMWFQLGTLVSFWYGIQIFGYKLILRRSRLHLFSYVLMLEATAHLWYEDWEILLCNVDDIDIVLCNECIVLNNT